MIQQPDDEHYRLVANRLMAGAVVPFLGAGVGLCGRPAEAPWERGRYLPSGMEFAAYLARDVDYPAGEPFDLLRVSQYVDVKLGNGPLYEALHAVFDADYAPTPYTDCLPRFREGQASKRRGVSLLPAFRDDESTACSSRRSRRRRGVRPRHVHRGGAGQEPLRSYPSGRRVDADYGRQRLCRTAVRGAAGGREDPRRSRAPE